jgi:hypothetical protein
MVGAIAAVIGGTVVFGSNTSTSKQVGHLKQDHRMGRNYLTGRDGNRINAVLAAAGYNFSLLLRWFEELLRVLSSILWHALLAVHGRPRRRPPKLSMKAFSCGLQGAIESHST